MHEKREVYLCMMVSLGLSACSEDNDSNEAPPIPCTIRYIKLGGAPSGRVDILRQAEPGVIWRQVFEGGAEDTAAIFYRLSSDTGSGTLHQLDDDKDGAIDAVMEHKERLVGRIDSYQIDAIADDGQIDSLQVSVPLNTGASFFGWNPGRVFYTLPCGPRHNLTAQAEGSDVSIDVDLGPNGTIENVIKVAFDGEQVRGFQVDNDQDGVSDYRAEVLYTDSLVTSVVWRDRFFAKVAQADFVYDQGRLVRFVEDMDGDGTSENELQYEPSCWVGDSI